MRTMKEINTVGELRKATQDLPDDMPLLMHNDQVQTSMSGDLRTKVITTTKITIGHHEFLRMATEEEEGTLTLLIS